MIVTIRTQRISWLSFENKLIAGLNIEDSRETGEELGRAFPWPGAWLPAYYATLGI